MSYLEKLKDPRWQKKRLEILARDGWACKKCGNNTNTLNVHHIVYLRDCEPWDTPSGFLITVCEDCHSKEDFRDPESIVSQIGNLLNEIWRSGYTVSDLISFQEATSFCKKRQDAAFIDLSLDARYLEDYAS